MGFMQIINCLQATLRTTAMNFMILIGTEIFSLTLGMSKLPMLMAEVIGGLPLHRYVILLAILFLYVILGCVLDGIAMIILTIPILFPVIAELGFDPIIYSRPHEVKNVSIHFTS
jgi:TRAP-type C4-dicarboxylate transport system permease large subunit